MYDKQLVILLRQYVRQLQKICYRLGESFPDKNDSVGYTEGLRLFINNLKDDIKTLESESVNV